MVQVSPNAVFFVTGSLFIVWMQRNGRWSNLLKVMNGQYAIKPIGPKTTTTTPGSTSNTETIGGRQFTLGG
jgi:hypothetical protein